MMNKPIPQLGLIVNPIAGIGGKVGLKGSDGASIQKKALILGAIPESENRTIIALQEFNHVPFQFEIITYPGTMGEFAASRSGLRHTVIGSIDIKKTTAGDTRQAARDLLCYGVKLILFAGGDGTARDIHSAIGQGIPVLGLPTGVKIHSAVFASSPRNAGVLTASFLSNQTTTLREAEVMDIDENALRNGFVSTRLYGYLTIPYQRRFLQGLKTASSRTEKEGMRAIARCVVENLRDDFIYLVGPGTTTEAITTELDLPKTLVGVDVLLGKEIIIKDANEAQLLQVLEGRSVKIIVSPIGGQGYIFGRGNQQLSHQVIRRVGKNNIIVVATREKIHALRGKPLFVDTGNLALDEVLIGHIRVITGYNDEIVCRIAS